MAQDTRDTGHGTCCDCSDGRLGDHCEAHMEAARGGEPIDCDSSEAPGARQARLNQDDYAPRVDGCYDVRGPLAPHRHDSPWVRRASAGTLPPSAHGARAYSGRDGRHLSIDTVDTGSLRIDTRAGTYTVADLQRAAAREAADR